MCWDGGGDYRGLNNCLYYFEWVRFLVIVPKAETL